ncbi:40S ribosomal protein S19 protein, putative [Leishmania tarentolae]|uniref:40S ribosomal protein S19 protein, putative n=1 Tax=Leishmania tarentolae TaxID=5689 RepID=A0A640KRU7_LEITA|nr:40S ribosomal protein S19 protein, putative [Leishmania tarentolae]
MSLLAGTKLADVNLESQGVRELVALACKALTRLRTRLHETELRQRLAGPVEGAGGGLHSVLGTAAVVLLVAKALAEASVTHSRAQVDGAQNGGTPDVVPVRVLRCTFAAVGALHDLGAVWYKDLPLLFEVASCRLDPEPRTDVLQGRTLPLADATDLVLGSSHDAR